MNSKKPGLEDKLFTVRRKEYKDSHIKVRPHLCKNCLTHICVHICPAGVYEWNEAKRELDIRYENCLECGTCRVACEMQSIEWSNPIGGTGVAYRHG